MLLFKEHEMAAITVSTDNYEFVHGRAPRGVGSWAFYLGGAGRWLAEPVFAPGMMSYGQAKAWAVREARAQGLTEVVVGS